MRVLACNSDYGAGGVGQHFAQMVEVSRSAGCLARYYAPKVRPRDPKGRSLPEKRWHDWLIRYTPVRFSPAWRSHVINELFDRQVARRIEAPLDRYMGFVGKSLRTFQQARSLGAELELLAANTHVDNLGKQHAAAEEQHGLDDTWLNGAQRRKTLREYELADTIYVHSDYTRRSFQSAGIPAEKLERIYLHVHPRFQPSDRRPDDRTFRIAYVGRIEATKGIPLLLKAFSRLSVSDKQLTLVGGWSTLRMRKYMEPWLDDDRICMAPGDPLPVLHDADVFVHPTYEDGFGYAPMEALACGVPVIATEDTGMKEYIRHGENGYVVPTGQVDPIVDRLEHLRQHPMAATASLLPGAYDAERAAGTERALAAATVHG
jgi:glycosyltransferase involved in cell wall biosynthesis